MLAPSLKLGPRICRACSSRGKYRGARIGDRFHIYLSIHGEMFQDEMHGFPQFRRADSHSDLLGGLWRTRKRRTGLTLQREERSSSLLPCLDARLVVGIDVHQRSVEFPQSENVSMRTKKDGPTTRRIQFAASP